MLLDGDGYAIDGLDPLDHLDSLELGSEEELPVDMSIDHHLEPSPEFLKD